MEGSDHGRDLQRAERENGMDPSPGPRVFCEVSHGSAGFGDCRRERGGVERTGGRWAKAGAKKSVAGANGFWRFCRRHPQKSETQTHKKNADANAPNGTVHQDMRELRITAEDPDTRPDTETLAEWYGEAETVLATLRDRDKAAAAKKQKRRGKLQRVMGQHWLHELENVLMTVDGRWDISIHFGRGCASAPALQ